VSEIKDKKREHNQDMQMGQTDRFSGHLPDAWFSACWCLSFCSTVVLVLSERSERCSSSSSKEMKTMFGHEKLDVYQISLQCVACVIERVSRLKETITSNCQQCDKVNRMMAGKAC